MSTPPETPPLALAARALRHWSELAAAYDAIEIRLARAAWSDVAELGGRLDEHERELAELMPAITATRDRTAAPDAALLRMWSAIDTHARGLADRLPALLRAATAARNAAAARLARSCVGRSQAERYRSRPAPSPRFTSRSI